MSDNCANLLAVLKEQSDVVNILIDLGLTEVDAFKKDDTSSLLSITEKQRDAVDRMHHLEQLKVSVLRDMGIQLPVEDISINQVLEFITDFRSEITEESKRLAGLVRRLQDVNETNRLLASMSLSFVRTIQRALGMAASGYDAQGTPSEPPGLPGRLDASV